MKNISIAYTHNGLFHADEVFGSALLYLLFPDIEIKRVSALPESFEGIAFDIGLGKFDHHQKNREYRENGIPYAAFGLLWKEFGEILVSKDAWHIIDRDYVQQIDLSDNTGEHNLLSLSISALNPICQNDEESRVEFDKAVKIAKELLMGWIKTAENIVLARKELSDKVLHASNGILCLDKYLPWKENVIGTDIEFVVYPGLRNDICVCGVPVSLESNELKIPFPKKICGMESQCIEKITGIDGVLFCHLGGFIASTKNYKTAFSLIEWVRKENCKK